MGNAFGSYNRAMNFDPDAAAAPGSGIFGLPHTREESAIVLIPVPYDATTSYGNGTRKGPAAIRDASVQVDLLDLQFGRVYERGIFIEEGDDSLKKSAKEARKCAEPVIERGGACAGSEEVRPVDEASARMNEFVYERTKRVLGEGKTPGVVGGDHSTPFGSIRACAEANPGGIGVLQVDAHMDLRESYEGFRWSHASIMWNVLKEIPQVTRLVQIGIRDVGAGEIEVMKSSGGRVQTHFDLEWAKRIDGGEPFAALCAKAIEALPRDVYVSVDIDGLDPALCPGTGTPVAGGLSFNQFCMLVEILARSGRRVVGFDLVEVCPTGRDEWDANVGARVLYKLCGMALGGR